MTKQRISTGSTIVQCESCGLKREINSTPNWQINVETKRKGIQKFTTRCRKHHYKAKV